MTIARQRLKDFGKATPEAIVVEERRRAYLSVCYAWAIDDDRLTYRDRVYMEGPDISGLTDDPCYLALRTFNEVCEIDPARGEMYSDEEKDAWDSDKSNWWAFSGNDSNPSDWFASDPRRLTYLLGLDSEERVPQPFRAWILQRSQEAVDQGIASDELFEELCEQYAAQG